MGTPTNYFVDPNAGNDTTGDGSVGNPWKTVQHALNTITRDTANGDQINVKTGAADVLSAPLSFATYGSASAGEPLIIRGYTSAANDGGIGEISGGGSVGIVSSASTATWLIWIDMKLHNCGAATVLDQGATGVRWNLENCEISTSTGDGANLRIANYVNCYFHDVASGIVSGSAAPYILNCVFENCSDYAVEMSGSGAIIADCIISVPTAGAGGIYVWDSNSAAIIINNTIYSSSGTGKGILFRTANDFLAALINNHFEGFSGAGGVGIDANGGDIGVAAGNTFYNNTTDTSYGDRFNVPLADDTSLASSPLTDPGNGDFSVSTALKAAGWPTAFKGISTNQFLDAGAAQREEAGGGLLVHPGMSGGMRG